MKVSFGALALLAGLSPLYFSSASGSSLPLTSAPQEPVPQKSPPKEQASVEMAELFVIVVNDDDEPVFKASVSLNIPPRVMEEGRKNGKTSFTLPTERTDPEGEAVLEVEPGEARTLSVSCRDLASERLTIEIPALKPGESRDVEVRLRTKDDAVFQARVVDDATGEPVADVDIQEEAMNGSFGGDDTRLVRSAKPILSTAEDGTFQVAAATWRRKGVTLLAPGYAPTRCIVGGAEGFPGQDEPLEVRLKAGSALRVELKSAPADVAVKVSFYNSSIDYQPATVPGSGAFGSFQITGVPDELNGGFVVHDIPPGAEATAVVTSGRTVLMERRFTPAEGGETLTESFNLARNGSITGVLQTGAGDPVSDHELVAVATTGFGGLIQSYEDIVQTTRTAADGSFSFDGLTSRKYKVGMQIPRQAPVDAMIVATEFVDLEVGAPEVEPLEMVLIKGMFIRGRIVGPDGQARRGHVSAATKEYAWSAQGNTKGDDESFEIGPLIPGSYSLSTMSSAPDCANGVKVEAEAGTTDLVLHLREAGNVSGRIVSASTGEALPGRVSYLESPDAGRMTQGFTGEPTSDFEFKRIAVGQGYVVAEVEGVGFSPVTLVTIRPGETTSDVVLKVSPAATVAVSTGDRTDLVYAIVDVNGYKEFARFVGEAGALEVSVPTGPASVTFKIKDSEDTYQLSVEAKPGEVVPVNADDAKFVPAPPESSKTGDSSPEPDK